MVRVLPLSRVRGLYLMIDCVVLKVDLVVAKSRGFVKLKGSLIRNGRRGGLFEGYYLNEFLGVSSLDMGVSRRERVCG